MKQKTFFAILVVAALRLAGAGVSAAYAQDTAQIDVTGKWAFEATTTAGPFSLAFTIKQSGDGLTGQIAEGADEFPLTGMVRGRDFALMFASALSPVITYAGTITSNDAMTGTVVFDGATHGTFTAKRVR